MKDTPINHDVVSRLIAESQIPCIGKATIREVKKLINEIEKETGQKFVRMEMGVPGLPATQIGVDAEIQALKNGCAAIYPEIDGLPELKTEMARFVKLFMDVDVTPENCIPTVGSMQGGYAAFMTVNRMYKEKDTTLMLDPCFPVHKQQHAVIGTKFEAFDVYDYRGDKLKEKIESYLKKGNIASIMFSNPNNPSWICFTDKELKIIADLANQYNVLVLEDLAYFGMDFRKDYSKPGVPPFQPSVAKYTDNYIMFVSGSKVFSYAGQRIGMMVISPKVFNTHAPDLKRYYASDKFGKAMVYGVIYSLSSGTAHSAQYALAAMLKAANDGKFNFVEEVKEYGEKARIMKKMFTDNGFKIVYDKDENDPLADGFYFTFSYPGFTGEQLLEELMYYGISAISLAITGGRTEGMRACVSLVLRHQFPDLEYRLKKFYEHHPVNSD
ncbi:MAG TPA: pyridoxal phosphate-dependent aminotransferase [Bacteroidales bacterium]|nr:pyridoxal phosphate-dependent aminotransferase [Bacteroidales bacterium]HOH83657.1 pyridoxal phosphate-dependent aminotransferase [Bacteroidales bacterium]HPI30165.1 pyridoxal phosphate-dependent aminotransferase [Bacteroidales bacterium]